MVDVQAGLSDDPLRTLVEVFELVLHLPLMAFIFFTLIKWFHFIRKTTPVCMFDEKTCHQDFRSVPIQTGLCNQDGKRLESSDLQSRGIECSENKSADQLRGYHAADLHLCFVHIQKDEFLMARLIIHNEGKK